MVSRDLVSAVCLALGLGVTRSKRQAMRWKRKAAEATESGYSNSCMQLASAMYADHPYAREVGHVEEAAGVAMSAGVVEGHDVPPDVLTSVIYWLRKSGHNPVRMLDGFLGMAQYGAKFCVNDGCEVVGPRKDFKVCPQCKTARYCAVPGDLALRANFKVLQMAHYLAPVVDAMHSPL